MIKLRAAKDRDMELVMAWRSNPLIYQGFHRQQGPLSFEEHYNWWKSQKNWRRWVIVYGAGKYARDVGIVDVRHLNTECPEIGFLIGEIPLWGKGVGKQAANLGINWLRKHGYKKVCAEVVDANERSKKLLQNLGFKLAQQQETLILELVL
jgi:RimJ/RimL family protein N-acetyltransferase